MRIISSNVRIVRISLIFHIKLSTKLRYRDIDLKSYVAVENIPEGLNLISYRQKFLRLTDSGLL